MTHSKKNKKHLNETSNNYFVMGISHKHVVSKNGVRLKRELGLFQTTVCGVGIIVGAGIYVLIGIAAGYAGNAIWLSFLIAAMLAALTGLGYAELSSFFKGDAGEYDYTKEAFNERFAKLIGYLVLFTGVTTAATVALGFAGYLNSLTDIPIIVGAILLLCLMSYVNFKGIKESSWLNVIFTFLEIIGLLIVMVIGLKFIGKIDYMEMNNGFTGVFKAAALAFFAYTGYETIIKLTEETKNPTKTIPRAIILSIIITSILYVLVALAAVSIVGWEELSISKAPLATVVGAAFGAMPALVLVISLIALFSTSNTVLMALLTTSRTIYGMAKEKSLPDKLSIVAKKNRTPWVAIVITLGASSVLALLKNIEFIANLSNIFIFLTFAIINVSLIVLRYKKPNAKRKFMVPGNIGKFPVLIFLGVIASLFMLYYSFMNAFFAI